MLDDTPVSRPPAPTATVRVRRAAILAVGLAAALIFFQAMFGFGLVSADAAYWKSPYGDMLTSLSGAEAMFRAPWTFPVTVTRSLTAPEPLAAVYTDSIPWLAFAMKLLGLDGRLNLLGLCLLISTLLQPLAMIALLRACRVASLPALLAGAAIALLTPAWIARQFGHIALTAHWLILFALALAIRSAREGLTPRRVLLFCLLGGLATGVHAYFLVSLGLIFLSAIAAEIAQRRPAAMGRGAVALLRFLLTLGVCAIVLGYGVGQGRSGGSGALGLYSMNLLQPLWPHPSALTGQHWDEAKGWFTGGIDATGGQQFEGLNYLGGGAILLMLGAFGLAVAKRRGLGLPPGAVARFWPLAAAVILLALFAVGPKAYFGPWPVWSLSTPQGRVGEALGLFRAHGRFFWAAGYMAVALTLAWLAHRLPPRPLILLLTAAVALQMFDVSGLLGAVRHRYQTPWPLKYPARLDSPAITGRPWVVFPAYYCSDDPKEQALISQIAWLALRHDGSTSTANTARGPRDLDCRLPLNLGVDAAPQDPRLLMVIDRTGTHGRLPLLAARTDCSPFEYGLVCGRGVADILDGRPNPVPELRQPDTVPLRPSAGQVFTTKGWAFTDEGAVPTRPWTSVPFLAPMIGPDGLEVTFVARALGGAPRMVEAYSDNIHLAARSVTPGAWRAYSFRLPASLAMSGQRAQIDFAFTQAPPHAPAPAGSPLGDVEVRAVTFSQPVTPRR